MTIFRSGSGAVRLSALLRVLILSLPLPILCCAPLVEARPSEVKAVEIQDPDYLDISGPGLGSSGVPSGEENSAPELAGSGPSGGKFAHFSSQPQGCKDTDSDTWPLPACNGHLDPLDQILGCALAAS